MAFIFKEKKVYEIAGEVARGGGGSFYNFRARMEASQVPSESPHTRIHEHRSLSIIRHKISSIQLR